MIRIKARKRGPLVIDLGEGDALELTDPEGRLVDLTDRKRLFLCRCGGSATPPFCDGTHNRLPFEAAAPVPDGDSGEGGGAI